MILFIINSFCCFAQQNKKEEATQKSINTLAKPQHFLGLSLGGANSNEVLYTQFGLRYEIKYPTEKSTISIEEVVSYWGNNGIYYIGYAKTILGLDFNFGKKLYYIIGGGVLNKLLIANTSSNFKKIVFGGKLNTGVGYRISTNVLIALTGQYYFDISPAATYVIPSHFGSGTKENIRAQVFFIQFNISF